MSVVDDYLRDVEAHLRVNDERKRQIVDELRSHLRDKVADARLAAPDRPAEEVEREVLRGFGNPRDLAVAYEPDGPVLRNDAGEVVLRVGRAVGRGTTKVLKALGVALAALLVLTVVVGVWGFYEVRPYVEGLVEDHVPLDVYEYYEVCEDPCGGAFAETFYVHPEARDVRFDLGVRHVGSLDRGGGNVTLVVADPAGDERYNRTIAVAGDTHLSYRARWAPASGDWTVAYRFEDLVGVVDVAASTTGIRLGG